MLVFMEPVKDNQHGALDRRVVSIHVFCQQKAWCEHAKSAS